jgi:hypothetical protein
MNRLDTDDFAETLTNIVDVKIIDSFLIYITVQNMVYGLWLYQEDDRKRIAHILEDLKGEGKDLEAGRRHKR